MKTELFRVGLSVISAGLLVPLVTEHQKAIWVIMLLVIIGMGIGLLVYFVTEAMIRYGWIRDGFEYWLFQFLMFIFLWFTYACALEVYRRPPVPEIHRYAPDHVHIDYK